MQTLSCCHQIINLIFFNLANDTLYGIFNLLSLNNQTNIFNLTNDTLYGISKYRENQLRNILSPQLFDVKVTCEIIKLTFTHD